jgi:hypothetical protein
MKTKILAITFMFHMAANAQSWVADSIYMGNAYANEVFYSLKNDSVHASQVKNWDIAFSAIGGQNNYFLGVLASHINGVNVYLKKTNTATEANWNSFDSAGYKGWTKLLNTDTSLFFGAFNRDAYVHPDYSWATYNSVVSGQMDGKYIYLLTLNNGPSTEFKKLWLVNKKSVSGAVSVKFRYANLDGSADTTVEIMDILTNYPNKNYMYYSIRNNAALNREPSNLTWDLSFNRYVDTLYDNQSMTYLAYNVMGVQLNKGVMAVKAQGVPVDAAILSNYQQDLSYNTSTIGWDWKISPMGPPPAGWTIVDSLSYFVKDVEGNIWQLAFTGFAGTSTGKVVFKKKQLVHVGNEIVSGNFSSFAVFPNPTTDVLNILFSSETPSDKVNLSIVDMNGRMLMQSALPDNGYLNNYSLNVKAMGLPAGTYFVSLNNGKTKVSKTILVQ